MHISDQVRARLAATGWTTMRQPRAYQKRITGYAPAGTVSDGARVVVLTICPAGRWLERVDQGLGRTVREIDLRDYPDRPDDAISAALA